MSLSSESCIPASVDATVVSSMELRQSTQTTSTRHVEIDLPLSYVTADNLSVCPVNSWDVVESLCERLHYTMYQSMHYTMHQWMHHTMYQWMHYTMYQWMHHNMGQ